MKTFAGGHLRLQHLRGALQEQPKSCPDGPYPLQQAADRFEQEILKLPSDLDQLRLDQLAEEAREEEAWQKEQALAAKVTGAALFGLGMVGHPLALGGGALAVAVAHLCQRQAVSQRRAATFLEDWGSALQQRQLAGFNPSKHQAPQPVPIKVKRPGDLSLKQFQEKILDYTQSLEDPTKPYRKEPLRRARKLKGVVRQLEHRGDFRDLSHLRRWAHSRSALQPHSLLGVERMVALGDCSLLELQGELDLWLRFLKSE